MPGRIGIAGMFLLWAAYAAIVSAQLVPNDTGRMCRGGEYDNGNLCVPCPPRTVSSYGSFKCTACPRGEFPYSSQDSCEPCYPGFFLEDGWRCTECGSERFSKRRNSLQCTPCPANQTTGVGDFTPTACFGCGRGEYLLQKGVNCKQCPTGSFQDEVDQSSCKACPPGTGGDFILSIEGLETPAGCKKCTPGMFGKLLRSSVSIRACKKCPWGSYAPYSGAVKCEKCPKGSVSMKDRRGCVPRCQLSNANCRKRGCPPGTEPFRGNVTDCRKCPIGLVNDRVSVTPCAECLPFAYPPYTQILKPNAARDVCACPSNQVLSQSDDNSCESCPPNAKKASETQCVCPRGQRLVGKECRCFFKRKSVGSKCVPCTAEEVKQSRTKRDEANSNTCNLCKQGYYRNSKAKSCKKCPRGFTTYGQNDRQKCVKCKESYRDNQGRLTCGCKPGHRFIRPGVCRACPVGLALDKRYNTCEPCGERFYGDVAGLSKCKLCPVGRRYSQRHRQTSCPPACPPNASLDFSQCVCDTKFIRKPSPSKTSPFTCVRCPAGEQRYYNLRRCDCAPGTGRRQSDNKCVACPRGSFGEEGRCRKCEVNTIAPKRGMTKCTSCPVGSYSIFKGGFRCVKCPAGSYVTKKGNCGKCAPGFRVRNGECIACVDSVSNGGDASFCTPCPSGKVPAADGQSCVSS